MKRRNSYNLTVHSSNNPEERPEFTVTKEITTIIVQVQPNASQNKIVRFEEEVLYAKIAAPPVKGKANQELIKFLSRILEISRNDITIEKGMTSRRKVIAIKGLGQNQVTEQLKKSGL